MRNEAMKYAIIAALLLATSSHASADDGDVFAFKTGNDLYELCKAKAAACPAYLFGALDGITWMQTALGGDAKIFCVENVTGYQLVDVVMKYMREHPEKRHIMASTIMVDALFSYPGFLCPGTAEAFKNKLLEEDVK